MITKSEYEILGTEKEAARKRYEEAEKSAREARKQCNRLKKEFEAKREQWLRLAEIRCPECLGTKGEWIDRKDPRNPTYMENNDADVFEECRECEGTGVKSVP